MTRSARALRGLVLPLLALVGCHGEPEVPHLPASCMVAEDPSHPFIVEWSGANASDLDLTSKKHLVVVSYVGCVMKVLPDCVAEGAYKMSELATPQTDSVEINKSADLFAKLPLGVASLKAQVEAGSALKLSYVVVGREEATAAPTRVSGACEGATHYVDAITVGAYSLDAFAREGGAAGVAVPSSQVGVDVSGSSNRRNLRQAGDVAACRKATEGCTAPLRIGLKELAPAGVGEVKTGALGGLPAIAMPEVLRAAPSFASSLQSADVELLQLVEAARKGERDDARSSADRAAAWDRVVAHESRPAPPPVSQDGQAYYVDDAERHLLPPETPAGKEAEKRRDAWREVERAEAERKARIAEICGQHASDREKLEKLEKLGEETVSSAQKRIFRKEFEALYAPWQKEIERCDAQSQEADLARKKAEDDAKPPSEFAQHLKDFDGPATAFVTIGGTFTGLILPPFDYSYTLAPTGLAGTATTENTRHFRTTQSSSIYGAGLAMAIYPVKPLFFGLDLTFAGGSGQATAVTYVDNGKTNPIPGDVAMSFFRFALRAEVGLRLPLVYAALEGGAGASFDDWHFGFDATGVSGDKVGYDAIGGRGDFFGRLRLAPVCSFSLAGKGGYAFGSFAKYPFFGAELSWQGSDWSSKMCR